MQSGWRRGVLLLLACGLAACDPGTPSPGVSSLSPQPVAQTRLLHVFGESFGTYVEDQSAVLISGKCAQVASWRDDRIDVVVPPGVGTGARLVQIVLADGRRVTHEVVISGEDLEAEVETPCRFSAGRTPEGDAGGSADMSADGSVEPSCRIAVAPGMCSGDSDCGTIQGSLGLVDSILRDCAIGCVGEPDLDSCASGCFLSTLGVSGPCGTCFGEHVGCVVSNCVGFCFVDAQSRECLACQADSGCDAQFEACSGVRVHDTVVGFDFLRLVSQGAAMDPFPGAEIDTVQLLGIDFTERYPDRVVRFEPGSEVVGADPSLMLGPPRAFFAWPETSVCQTLLAQPLGFGGSVVLSFSRPLVSGDQLRVLELGSCEMVDSPLEEVATPEPVQVYVGSSPDGPWLQLGVAVGHSTVLTVP